LQVNHLQEDDKIRQRAWVKMALLYQKAFRVLAERLFGVGLSVAQFDLLVQLVQAEPEKPKQSDLAKRLLVTKGNISGMVTRMAEQGTLQRYDDPNDRRSNRICITEQGRALHQAGSVIQQKLVCEMFEGVDHDTLRNLEEVVSNIIEKLGSEQAPRI
jgi:DNA-binding MarR family transcriptional regulator